jgi:DNA-binding SARP family transcriptional activator/class 3 adenylate cyclase
MDFRILGPLEVLEEGRRVALGGAKPRAVLALLLVHRGETLGTERLIDELWGERPPATAAKSVKVYVWRLRKALAGAVGEHSGGPIVTREHGYELALDPERLDAHRFERLLGEGRAELAAGRPEHAASALEAGLSLWRGPPLADLAFEPFAEREIARLEDLHVAALEQLVEAKLALGRHAEVVAQLERLIADHPYRERLRAQLMLALYRSERQADALQAYQEARRILVEELGIEPSRELRRLHDAILQQDETLDLPAEPERRQPDPEAGMAAAVEALDGRPPPAAAGIELPERLAEKVRLAASSLEGERKQVTVLFADVQGSMELAESVDPEVWRGLLERFLGIVGEAVHSYEGMVTRFTGDGAMALFGAPIAHEDHARRACYAALRLRDALADYGRELRSEHGLGFAVRLGLNSGEVVVGAVGEDLQLDYTAVGHTVGLARRMEALAEPGKPYLTGRTAALVEGYFQLEDLGEVDIKGARERVHAYALAGVGAARTPLEAAAERGLTPLVGREPELAALEAALARAGESGQVVGVVAEPGVGKSRLCHEFAERCRKRGLQLTVGRGMAHGRRVPLLPVIEMLRAYFGISADDDPQAARAKVAGPLLDEGFRDLLPVLFEFLGVPDPERPVPAQMAPEARQRALFAALRRLVGAGGERLGVLVVEDLHWLDPGSEAFLANLVDSLPGARTLLVVNFRPEYQADWMRRSSYEQLPLAPLESDDTARMVEALTGRDPSVDGLSALIAARTGGNPFFIEEVVRDLTESGVLEGARGEYRLAHPVEEIEIPVSVQALLAARIDRLTGNEKAVLQSAAVIGREFSEPVLRQVTGLPEPELATTLDALVGVELVYQRALYPEAEYAFRHPLTQEVADRSQLREPRARMHAAAATAVEELHPDRQDELAALISNHWEQAGEPLHAAHWGARAAAWAARSHPADALQQWRRVRTLVRDQPHSPEVAGLTLAACVWTMHAGARFGLAEDELAETYREADELATATGDKSVLAMVRSAYGVTRAFAGGPIEEAIAGRREAQELARQAGNLELQVSLGPGLWLAFAGRNREALAEVDRDLDIAGADFQLGRQVIGVSAVILATLFRGWVLMELGRLPEGRAALEEALRLARDHDDLECFIWAQAGAGLLSFHTGEPGDGLAHATEALELAERQGSSLTRAMGRTGLALAQLARADYDQALAVASEGLELMRTARTFLQFEGGMLAAVAAARLGLEDIAGASSAAAKGAAIAATRGARVQEASCRWILGRGLLTKRPDDARIELERALELARDDGPIVIPHVLLALAQLAALQGDNTERLRQLEQAHRLFEQQGATGHARRVAAEIATATA